MDGGLGSDLLGGPGEGVCTSQTRNTPWASAVRWWCLQAARRWCSPLTIYKITTCYQYCQWKHSSVHSFHLNLIMRNMIFSGLSKYKFQLIQNTAAKLSTKSRSFQFSTPHSLKSSHWPLLQSWSENTRKYYCTFKILNRLAPLSLLTLITPHRLPMIEICFAKVLAYYKHK